MDSELHQDGGVTFLSLKGNIDLNSHKSLSEALNQAWNTPSVLVVLDLQEVALLSSSGVGALLAFHNRLQKNKRHLALVCLSEVCTRVLELLQLNNSFSIYKDAPTAIKAHL